MKWCSLLVAASMCGCVTLSPAGAHVSVYRAPLDAPPALRSLPEGCRRLSAKPPISMPELDLEGQKEPFRVERNETGAAGGNVLLVLTQVTRPRQDFECPASSPITDCPPSFGAWYRVVFESYACTPDALHTLSSVTPSSQLHR